MNNMVKKRHATKIKRSIDLKVEIETGLTTFSKKEVELMQKACQQKNSTGCIRVTYNDGESEEFLPDNMTNRKRFSYLLED